MMITHDSPLGRLALRASDRGLIRIAFRSGTVANGVPACTPVARAWLDLARRELDAYFAGRLRSFTVAVDLERVGGPDRRVLHALDGIAFGQTTTYGALAAQLRLVGPRPSPGRSRNGPQPGPDRGAVSPCPRRQRRLDRLRRRPPRQAGLARLETQDRPAQLSLIG